MKKLLLILFLFTLSMAAETPKDGLSAILSFYKNKQIETLVKERYTELYKAKNEKDLKKIVTFLSELANDEKFMKEFSSFFEELLKTEPKLSKQDPEYIRETETGDIAKFKAKSGRTYRLYKMKSGKWGFHL
ncbi:MAG: hypothetical protein NE330_12040 [Lentisphaeraceae bacterium]|nr:hypothetical protein [Lentisphaeraceae bacterium]